MSGKSESIGETLRRLVHHYSEPQGLFEAVRAAHPEAGKRDIVLAALSVMIDQSQTYLVASRLLHQMAMERRGHR